MATNADRLTFRLSGIRNAILAIGIAVLTGCAENSTAPTFDDPTSSPPPAVQPVVQVQPHQTAIPEGAQQQFSASVSGGQATGLSWRANGGTISSAGLYTAGAVPGVFMVIGELSTGHIADTAYVTVVSSATNYQVLMQDQWALYTSDADLKTAYTGSYNPRKIYGNMDWTKVNLVPDPIFGKALRLTFLQQNPFHDTTTWPSGRPGAVMRTLLKFPQPVDAIWVRGRYKFDYDPVKQPYGWITKSPNDPSPYGGAYKLFFMHWESPYYERGSLVYNNFTKLDFQFYINTLTQTSEAVLAGQAGQLNEPGAPEFTNHEWYEFVYMYKKTGANSAESGAWVRRLTTGAGTLQAPSPWRWVRRAHTFDAPIPRAVSVEFGGNKNHGNEFDQWILWGPYEIVDGTGFANPFGVPM